MNAKTVNDLLYPPFPELLLVSMTSWGMEWYPFGHSGSTVVAVSPPDLLPNTQWEHCHSSLLLSGFTSECLVAAGVTVPSTGRSCWSEEGAAMTAAPGEYCTLSFSRHLRVSLGHFARLQFPHFLRSSEFCNKSIKKCISLVTTGGRCFVFFTAGEAWFLLPIYLYQMKFWSLIRN